MTFYREFSQLRYTNDFVTWPPLYAKVDIVNHSCGQVCNNQSFSCKLHLVRYPSTPPVLKEIFYICKLYRILHEFLHVWCKFLLTITRMQIVTAKLKACGNFVLTWLILVNKVLSSWPSDP